MRVLLLSTYDLGRQPFGLASPTAWLREAGHDVECADLAVQRLPEQAVQQAEGIAFYLPMHTATRLATALVPKIRQLNPEARLCAYGLYAPLSADHLRSLGFQTILSAEFEADLLAWASGASPAPGVSLPRLAFRTPDRSLLPVLPEYPALRVGLERRVTGITEASRGCKHLCRHCPVVPVYRGQFRIVPVEIVLADVRQQAAAGATHITFGDPDFFNGPTHARRIIEALHQEFPQLTYDVTIKIEHLRQQRKLLPLLKATGCLFLTSAVESLQDDVLRKLEKGHTRADFLEVVQECRALGLTLVPTFIPFTPWTTCESYQDLLHALASLDLVEHVSPVQLALRLLIPAQSRLRELPEIGSRITGYDAAALLWRWRHEDPAVDQLAASTMAVVSRCQRRQAPRSETFTHLWQLAFEDADDYTPVPRPDRATVPYLEEPWYC